MTNSADNNTTQMFTRLIENQKETSRQFGEVYDHFRDLSDMVTKTQITVERLAVCIENDLHRTPCEAARRMGEQLSLLMARVESHIAAADEQKKESRKRFNDLLVATFRIVAALIIGGLSALLIAGLKVWQH